MGTSSCQFVFVIFSLVIFCCDLCDAKLRIARCCPEHQRIRMINNTKNINDKVCVKVRVNGTVTDLSQTKVYTTSLELTNKTVMDTFEVVDASAMGILINETENFSRAMEDDHNQTIYLTEEAMLYRIRPNEYSRFQKIGSHMFCLGYQPVMPGVLRLKFFTMTEPISATTWRDYLQIVCPFISTVFLASVLVIYALLEELRKRHGLIFMSYVFNLLIASLLLVILNIFQLVRTNEREFCISFTLPFYFFILASFFWMNIMSLDMWQTFRGMVRVGIGHRGKLKRSDLRKYCIYCVYAWGIPLLMTLAVWRLDEVDLTYIPNFIKPNIALRTCFFEDGERFLYLYVPILILLIVNTILFVLTLSNMNLGLSAKLNQKNAASSRRNRFVLYIKLSAVMGINWLLEVIGSFFPEDIMIVADIYNGLIGVIVFFLFVFNKKTFEKLRTRSFASFKRSEYTVSTEATVTSVELGRTSFNHRGPRY